MDPCELQEETRIRILRRLDEERRRLGGFGQIVDVLPSVTRTRAIDGSHHGVIASDLTSATADATIAQEIEYHHRLGVHFEWKVYSHDSPGDLLDRLRGRGFEIGPREAVLVYDLSEPPPWIAGGDGREADSDVLVRRIEQLGQIDDFRRVGEAVFKKDYSFTCAELAAAVRAGSTEHRGYIAYTHPAGEPVSIGRLYTQPESLFGGLYGGGTLPAYRKRGFYRAVVAARARDALAAAARYLIVDALPTSRPILEHMGFRWVSDTWPCEWRPKGEGEE